MKNLIIAFFTILLLSSCGTDPEGVWQNDERENEQIVIVQTESNISVRLPRSRQWINFITIGGNEYMKNGNPLKFKFLSNDKMQLTDSKFDKTSTYSRVILQGEVTAINMQMTRKQVEKIIGEPEEIYEENLAEKWRYANGLILLFDEQGVFKIENK